MLVFYLHDIHGVIWTVSVVAISLDNRRTEHLPWTNFCKSKMGFKKRLQQNMK